MEGRDQYFRVTNKLRPEDSFVVKAAGEKFACIEVLSILGWSIEKISAEEASKEEVI